MRRASALAPLSVSPLRTRILKVASSPATIVAASNPSVIIARSSASAAGRERWVPIQTDHVGDGRSDERAGPARCGLGSAGLEPRAVLRSG